MGGARETCPSLYKGNICLMDQTFLSLFYFFRFYLLKFFLKHTKNVLKTMGPI
uniref:Uncharacterized protein n=1 Tax=Anguilla anguilla TaxID=7936 RepID=A0A0E9PNS3_ANGAN